ncbi:MAG: hypothetical protein GF334_07850 [Candidatus Altiarchaeales archaeon]|nr:hypothetical protein [Candidatus Altiarchaeales archaeon]
MHVGRRVFLVFVLAVFLRVLLWQLVPVTTDAAEHLVKAEYVAENHRIPIFEYVTGNDPWWYPPLYHIIAAAVYSLTGVLTVTSPLAGVLSLVAFYFFLSEFYPNHLNAFILLCFLPFHAYMSGLAYVTIMLFLWGLLAFYFHKKHEKTALRRYFVLSVVFSGAAALTHYHGLIAAIIISSVYVLRRHPKKALVFFIGTLLIASPWYIRNYRVFGNPVWPLFFEGKYGHGKTSSGYGFTGFLNILKASTFSSVFFDFWIGAPNSGEDLMDNVAFGREKYPLVFEAGAFAWILLVLIWSVFILRGLFILRHDGIVWLSFLWSVLAIPFLANARLIVFCVPFAVICASAGLKGVSKNQKKALLLLSMVFFSAVTLAYAYTYHGIIQDYLPFYGLMDGALPADARIMMPYTLQECLYYTDHVCIRSKDFPGGVPPEVYEDPSLVRHLNISHVCCDSLYWNSRPKRIKNFCQSYPGEKVIEYRENGVFGVCYKT